MKIMQPLGAPRAATLTPDPPPYIVADLLCFPLKPFKDDEGLEECAAECVPTVPPESGGHCVNTRLGSRSHCNGLKNKESVDWYFDRARNTPAAAVKMPANK